MDNFLFDGMMAGTGGSGKTRCRICEGIEHAHPQCIAEVTLADASNPPFYVYFGAGLLPPHYYYTDYSRVVTSAEIASLPLQQWIFDEEHQRQKRQWLVKQQRKQRRGLCLEQEQIQ